MAVYLIAAGDTGFCKIGKADDPSARLIHLQAGHWERFVILRTWPGSLTEESAMHDAFRAQRVDRDWFRFVPEMMTFEMPAIALVPEASECPYGILSGRQAAALAISNGLTVRDVCTAAGVAYSTFSRWRAGKTSPSLDVYNRLVTAAEGGALPPKKPRRTPSPAAQQVAS